MNPSLMYLAYIGIILFLGIITTIISKKIKIPNVLLLMLLGIGLGNITYKGGPLISFPDVFTLSIGVLALVLIVFDSTSRFKLREFDEESMDAIKLTAVFLIMCLVVLSIFTFLLYDVPILIAILFAAVIAGTAPSVVLLLMPETKNRIIQLLEVESIINTPLIVIIPFLIIEFLNTGMAKADISSRFLEQVLPFLQQIVVGIGAGILIGIIIFKFMRKQYSELISPLALIVAALLTYVLAEALDGSGVLAVTTLGLFFGSVYVKQKSQMQEFSSFFSYALEILVFILIGLIIEIPLTLEFFGLSIALFIIYLLIRYFAVSLVFGKKYKLRPKLFMTFNAPKGIAIAAVVFMLTTFQASMPEIGKITDLILVFMLYSVIFSSLVARFSKYFIHKEIIK